MLARVHVCKLVCSDAFDRARMPADPHGPSDDGPVHAAVHVSHRAHEFLREDVQSRLEAKDTEREEKQSGIHKVIRFMIKCAKIFHVRCAA